MMRPQYVDLKDWAASLIIDFPFDAVPILINDDWRAWGNYLAQCTSFANNGAPGTANYDDWLKYADAIYYTMEG